MPEETPVQEEEAEVESPDSVEAEEIALENNVPESEKISLDEKTEIKKEAVYVEGVEAPEFVETTDFSILETLKVMKKGLEFEDTEEHWSKEYVEFVGKLVVFEPTKSNQTENRDEAEEKIIGRPILEDFVGEEFKPDLGTNRVEFTKIALLMNGYGIPEECPATDIRFSDISQSECDEDAKVIYQGVKAGFIQGYPDGTFKSNRIVNRVEALKMLLAAGGKKEIQSAASSLLENSGLSENPFTDIDMSAWYAKYVLYSNFHGIVEGDELGHFYPGNPVTRADAVRMITKIVQNLE